MLLTNVADPDPSPEDPYVLGLPDPDPSILKQNSKKNKKNIDSYFFMTFLSLKNDVNVPVPP
jgi:hypothetical protein